MEGAVHVVPGRVAAASATSLTASILSNMRRTVLHHVVLVAALAGTAHSQSATVAKIPFEPEILAFEAADRASPPPMGGVVFTGSSSFRLWTNVAADFPGVPLLNRGFGGSILPEVVQLAPRLVLKYRPHLVLLYAGDNDINAGRTPTDVLNDYRTFASTVHSALPTARIAFVSIKPSPSRWALVDRMREANRLVQQEISRDTLATYVDVFTPMIGADGRPRAELFGPDSLHMTRAGYLIWRAKLAPIVH